MMTTRPERRARIQRMLTSLMETAEAAPTDIAGACEPPTLAEALTLVTLEANFAADYSEAMRIGLEARERLDLELAEGLCLALRDARRDSRSRRGGHGADILVGIGLNFG